MILFPSLKLIWGSVRTIWEKYLSVDVRIYSFHATSFFLYPLKIPENGSFSIFQEGYRKRLWHKMCWVDVSIGLDCVLFLANSTAGLVVFTIISKISVQLTGSWPNVTNNRLKICLLDEYTHLPLRWYY